MYATNYLETNVLNTLRGITFSAPSTVYVGLFLSNPGEAGIMANEVNYEGYQRIAVEWSTPGYDSVLKAYAIKNATAATFAKAPTAGGTVPYVGIIDSSTAGNMLLYGALTDAIVIDAGEAPSIVTGEIKYTADGDFTNEFRSKIFGTLTGTSMAGVTPYLAMLNGDTELVATNYGRKTVTFGAPTESDNAVMYMTNSVDVAFNQASTNWGYYNKYAMYDAASGGNKIWEKARGAEKYVNRLKRVQFTAGTLMIGLN